MTKEELDNFDEIFEAVVVDIKFNGGPFYFADYWEAAASRIAKKTLTQVNKAKEDEK